MTFKWPNFPGSPELLEKCRKLAEGLKSYGKMGVAFSGGVDSGFLAWFLRHVLARQVHALMADSPLMSGREKHLARSLAWEMGVSLHEIRLDPLQAEDVRKNPPNRCYFCKRLLMGALREKARQLGCDILVEGSHAGDLVHRRPGRTALVELGIGSPLADAGLFKDEIRTLAQAAGLSSWNKPSQSCLATRIPCGVEISTGLLRTIEQGEDILWNEGCRQVRVRVHDRLARIEVGQEDFGLFLDGAFRRRLLRSFEELGFRHVTLDMAGFQSGSMDGEAPGREPTAAATSRGTGREGETESKMGVVDRS